jgi:triosephosphate isomerase (TIM)
LSRPVFVINFKNYGEILGDRSISLATTAEEVCRGLQLDLIVAPPAPMLRAVVERVRVPVFGQAVGDQQEGKSTGAVIPESLKAAGCAGAIVNHSESRLPEATIRQLIPRLKAQGLASCLCCEDAREVATLASLAPEMLAVEPPELIGGGVAVSQAKPDLLLETSRSAGDAGFRGILLCGAGIVTGEDVRAATRLGMGGILVASSVVRSKDWAGKVGELATALL